MMLKILDIVIAIPHAMIFTVSYMAMLSHKNRKQAFWIYFVGSLSLFSIVLFLDLSTYLRAITFFIFFFFLIILLSNDTLKFKLLSLFLVGFTVILAEVIFMFFVNIVYPNETFASIAESTQKHLLMKLVYIVFMVLFLYLLYMAWKLIIRRTIEKNFLIYMLLAVGQWFSLVTMYIYSFSNKEKTLFFLCIVAALIFVLTDIGVLYIMRQIKEGYLLEQKNKEIETQLYIQFEQYNSFAQQIEASKNMKHDLNNHLATVYSLMDTDFLEAKKFLKSYSASLIDAPNLTFSDNRIVDAVLNNKRKYALQNDIDIQYHCEMLGECLIKNIDLCSIYSNILDNAIEACIRSKTKVKRVNLISAKKAGYLVIKCKNDYDFDLKLSSKGELFSSKREDQIGLGLLLIKEISEKYYGEFNYTYDKREFIATVGMKL